MSHPALPIIPVTARDIDDMRGQRFTITPAGRAVLAMSRCIAGADDDDLTIQLEGPAS